MKFDMNLEYTSDTGVEVKIEANVEGVVIHVKDGDHENHTTFSADDSTELANMFARASQHSRELNKRS